MRNSVIVLRGGVSYVETNYGLIVDAMAVAKRTSLRYPEAVVYCASSDRTMRIVQTMTVRDGRITDISVRYCGKVVTSDECIPEDVWDKFNAKRS